MAYSVIQHHTLRGVLLAAGRQHAIQMVEKPAAIVSPVNKCGSYSEQRQLVFANDSFEPLELLLRHLMSQSDQICSRIPECIELA
ncbi:MAG: hypothetical protein K0R85_113 [Devosia sp.]|nr:hypothetical protein [Devosia sp.]